jgi:thiamine biosynthesis protein ThiS
MTITVNGQEREIPGELTIAGLIAEHKLTPDKVAIELNRCLLRREKYDTPLKNGDAVEIVTFVGGGS